MGPKIRHYILAGAFLMFASVIAARDFSESPRAILLPDLLPSKEFQISPGAYAETAFTNNTIRRGEYDTFQIRSFVHHGLVAAERFMGTLFYATYLLSGPVTEGNEPGSERALWLMNAVQFEYGLTAQYRIGSWTLLGEYSRRSSHPLDDGFEDPAADIVRVGVALPAILTPSLTFRTLVRAGWVELWDFWEVDTIPDPRAVYTLNLAGEVDWRLPIEAVPLSAFGIVLWDPFLLRSGGIDGDLEWDLGLGFGEPRRRIELYLNYYRTSDTEQGQNERVPAELIGYGVRFIASF